MKRVIVESPFKGDVARNKRYLELCLRDCVKHGESPYASHKMLTDCLNDDDAEERKLGIDAGFAWKAAADLTVFYTDLGWSGGMDMALRYCRENDLPYETRLLWADGERVAAVRALVRESAECLGGWARALLTEIRDAGWSVAAHNDYRINDEPHTFWLFTHPDGRWLKGEGPTDVLALSHVIAAVRKGAEEAPK